MVTDTEDSLGSSAVTISPSTPSKRPRTFDTPKWRTVNETSEWLGSMAQVPVM